MDIELEYDKIFENPADSIEKVEKYINEKLKVDLDGILNERDGYYMLLAQ